MNAPFEATPDGIRTFLWSMGGAHPQLLEHESCWLERPRYTANGLAVLVTTIVATISATKTLGSVAPSYNPLIHIFGGLMWGSIVCVLDRQLLLGLFKLENGRLSMSLWAVWLRVGGAVLIALCVSQTAELALFERQLDVQVAVKQENDVAGQQKRLNARYGEIPALEAERSRLMTESRNAADEGDKASAAAACEADGTCGSGKPGPSTIYKIKKDRADQLAAVARVTAERNRAAIQGIDNRLSGLEASRSRELASFQKTASLATDFLARRAALAELEADPVHGLAVTSTGWILTLLSLFIELMPLVAKLTGPYGPYDAAYRSIQDTKAAAWRAEATKATGQIARILDQETMLNAAGLTTYETLIVEATSDALSSELLQQARADLEREIIERAVRVARTAAASVFDEYLHDDVVVSARARRQRADDELVDNELRKASAFRAMDDAIRDAAETLRDADAPLH